MSENPPAPISLNLTDDEFLRLHAAASAEGLEVNDFVVATLRKHTLLMKEIDTIQREDRSPPSLQI